MLVRSLVGLRSLHQKRRHLQPPVDSFRRLQPWMLAFQLAFGQKSFWRVLERGGCRFAGQELLQQPFDCLYLLRHVQRLLQLLFGLSFVPVRRTRRHERKPQRADRLEWRAVEARFGWANLGSLQFEEMGHGSALEEAQQHSFATWQVEVQHNSLAALERGSEAAVPRRIPSTQGLERHRILRAHFHIPRE